MVVIASELVLWLMDPKADDGPLGLAEMVHRPAWMVQAACQGEPLGTFFIERGGSMERAREICAGLPGAR